MNIAGEEDLESILSPSGGIVGYDIQPIICGIDGIGKELDGGDLGRDLRGKGRGEGVVVLAKEAGQDDPVLYFHQITIDRKCESFGSFPAEAGAGVDGGFLF